MTLSIYMIFGLATCFGLLANLTFAQRLLRVNVQEAAYTLALGILLFGIGFVLSYLFGV